MRSRIWLSTTWSTWMLVHSHVVTIKLNKVIGLTVADQVHHLKNAEKIKPVRINVFMLICNDMVLIVQVVVHQLVKIMLVFIMVVHLVVVNQLQFLIGNELMLAIIRILSLLLFLLSI